jgi:hypothetical protein
MSVYRDSYGNAVGYREVVPSIYPITERQAAREAGSDYAADVAGNYPPSKRRRLCGAIRAVGRATWQWLVFTGWALSGEPYPLPEPSPEPSLPSEGYQTRPMWP